MNRSYLVAAAAALCSIFMVPAVAQTASAPQFIDQRFLSAPYGFNGCVAAYEGDFNGDGRPDFAFPVCFQNANGTYSVAPQQPSFPELNSNNFYALTLNVADMNGDGVSDYVYTAVPQVPVNGKLGPAMVFLYLSNRDGSVDPAIAFNLGTNFSDLQGGVVTADFNGDGTTDIAIFNGNGILVLLNDGHGHLHAAPITPSTLYGTLTAADVNGDGKIDLLAISPDFPGSNANPATGIQVFLGKGDGTFTTGETYLFHNAFSGALAGSEIPQPPAVVADFNHDGHPDFAVLNGLDLLVYLGDGHGAFKPSATEQLTFSIFNAGTLPNNPTAAAFPFSLAIADFNRDGHLDLVVGAFTQGQGPATIAAIYSGNGDGTFSNPRIYSTGSARSIFVGDYNHDGNPDVVSTDTTSGIVLYSGDGHGNIHAAAGSLVPGATSIVSADFNGDHIPDLAVVSKAYLSSYFPCTDCQASVTILLGTGKGYFTIGKTYTVGLIDGNIAAGDLNHDGKIDLVVTRVQRQNESSPNPPPTDTSVLMGNGDGSFAEPNNMILLGGAFGFSYNINTYLVDVNHDGKLDLIGDWGTALGDGTGSFHPPISFPAPILPFIVSIAVGNFNGDNNLDLALATSQLGFEASGADLYTLLGDGKGNFTIGHHESHPLGSTFDGIGSVAVADINHDGKPDLLFTATNFEKPCCTKLEVELGLGADKFAPAVGYTIPTANTSILVADFNRDGIPDVALPGALFQITSEIADTYLLLGKGGGSFNPDYQTYSTPLYDALVMDVNGDGIPDIVGTNGLTVARLLNTGSRQSATTK
jgi:FG-GAP-like repeat/FG-GAP repeat